MSCINAIIKRTISTTAVREGKRNFKKFQLINKRGSRIFKQQQAENPDPDIPIDHRGVRPIGYKDGAEFVTVPEMIPELIVPDLKDFKLKAYVSYRTPDVVQTEFSAEDLFNVIYGPKIIKDFKEGKLLEDGSPKEPSANELQTPEEALTKAKRTGSEMI